MHGEIVEVKPSRSRPDRGIITVRCETLNQKGEVVQKLLARLMVPRRPVTA
jgi:acyl dehydratase